MDEVGGARARPVRDDIRVKDWFRRIRASESARASYTKGMEYFMEFVREKELGIGRHQKNFLSMRRSDIEPMPSTGRMR